MGLVNEGIKIVNILFNKFITTYHPYQYLSKEDLEDIKQDTYIVMLKEIERYDGRNKLSTFLTQRIKGCFIDCLRSIGRQKEKEANLLLENVYTNINSILGMREEEFICYLNMLNLPNNTFKEAFFEISNEQYTNEILEAIFNLPSKRIHILLGYYLLDKSIKDISAELGFNEDSGWVYKMKRESVERLQKILIEKGIVDTK